jgi:hypothetical protein
VDTIFEKFKTVPKKDPKKVRVKSVPAGVLVSQAGAITIPNLPPQTLANRVRLARIVTEAMRGVSVKSQSYTLTLVPVLNVGNEPSPAAVPVGFDPYLAGREAVRQLQTMEGGAWRTSELHSLFSISSAVLHRRRTEFRIIFWRDAKGDFFYPKWQFTPTGAVLMGIEEILQIFRSTDEWGVVSYFLSPRKSLRNKRPLDLLREGRAAEAIEKARLHAEEGTW